MSPIELLESAIIPALAFLKLDSLAARHELLAHPAAAQRMRLACMERGVLATPATLWEAMKTDDVLGACAARLLLYTLPGQLPIASVDGWNQYVDAWRPGKPKPDTWAAHWQTAGEVVRGSCEN